MPSIDIFAAFERFQQYLNLPIEGDLTLMILRGHLLIEEQVNFLIDNRVAKCGALKEADLTSFQKICLAEAIIEEFSPDGEDAWLWPAVKKLNKLRNDIAHNLTKPGIDERVADFVKRVPKKLDSSNFCHNFEFALWCTCVEVHLLIHAPDPSDFQNLP